MAVPTVEDRLEELLAMLPDSMRFDQHSERILRGMLTPVARIDNYLALKREGLLDSYRAVDVSDDQVPHLAGTVGFGADLKATGVLSVATLRRLTPAAVKLWKLSGTQPAIRACLAAVLGSRGWILSWFELRTVTGTARELHLIPSPGSGSGAYTSPEWTTDVWFMDPDASATPDTAEVVAVLDEIRTANERINLRRALLIDDLEAGEAFWGRQSSGTYLYQDADEDGGSELVVSDGGAYYPDLDGLSDAWTHYRWTQLLQVAGEGHLYVCTSTEGDQDDAYRIEIDQAGSAVRIVRVVAGVPTTLATAAAAISSTYAYLWTVTVAADPTTTTIHVYREGVLEVVYDDLAGARHGAGSIEWGAASGSANTVTLRGTLLFPPAAGYTRIGLNP